ncbi:hypothetical protein FOA52_006404 [Chlamydomonas sp. UWO 241]|nr:hypothetical protein FOA52_006404 [Chlamydomonas sp. UWO 241]
MYKTCVGASARVNSVSLRLKLAGYLVGVALTPRMPGIGYTFVLAGFLKILTLGNVANNAPVDAVRTAFGEYSQFFLVPVGLLMCLVAKKVVDANLQENKKFLAALAAGCVFMYFAMYKLLYRVDVLLERPLAPRPNMSGPMAEVRARAGDRDRTGLMLKDSRTYGSSRIGEEANDLAYYEGQTPSEIRAAEAAAAAASSAELDSRNPLRQAYRRAPGVAPVSMYGGGGGGGGGGGDDIMRPR